VTIEHVAAMRSVTRSPDPAFQILHPSFAKFRLASGTLERIASDCRWTEGPVWFGDARCLLWSDIPNNRIMRWDEETGAVSVFRKPSGHANGATRDRQGRLVTCEHSGRRITRTEYDGGVTVLLDRFEGKRLNSPNDVVVKSDGAIWFTDPTFGIVGYYQGEKAEQELPERVYRIDPQSGAATVVAEGIEGPNGLAFSPDESRLYIVQSRGEQKILSYEVTGGGAKLDGGRPLIMAGEGTPDGFRVDVEGNLWCGWGMSEALDGVRVFNPEGEPIGHIALPERCGNLCFGGRWRNRLFMTSSSSVYAVYVNTQGALGG
jgi:gluconolactonase